VVQPARDADGCAVAVGSAIIYRRSALDAIGGFAAWNVVEDLSTGYQLNCAGYQVRYVERALSIGLAPTDLANIYKQRGTWAIDTLRWSSPGRSSTRPSSPSGRSSTTCSSACRMACSRS
jgi:cellulose synthase (UDP-forming)